MARILLIIAACTGLWALVTWFLFTKIGLIAVPITAPLLGALLARQIINFVEEAHQSGKSAALKDVQGRYWSHRGHRIDIAEDVDAAKWLRAEDVRKIVPLPRDEVLKKHFGERADTIEPSPALRIRADALAEYLLKSTDSASLKFKVWLDREVLGGSVNPRYLSRK